MVNAISKTSFRLASILTLVLALCLALVPSTASAAAAAAPEALHTSAAVAGDSLSDWLTGIALSLPLVGTVRNFVPEVWSQNLNLQLRKARVMTVLTNEDYEGEISDKGDKVKITRPASIDIKDYEGEVTYDDPESTQMQLEITEQRYFGFSVDDVDAVQANTDLVGNYTVEGGQAMADDEDEYIAGHYADAHPDNVVQKADITAENVYSKFVEAGKRLDEQNVPQSGRRAVISPTMLALLLNADEFIKASNLGDNVVQTGQIGEVNGFSVFRSNSVVTADDGSGLVEHNLLGTSAAITFAMQLVKMEAMRLEKQFGDGVRGLHLYGSKTIRPEALCDLQRNAG